MASTIVLPATILLVFVATPVFGWKLCENVTASGTFTHMELSACTDQQLPCKLEKGTIPKIDLSFKPGADTKVLTIEVTALIVGVELPFPGLVNDACNPHFGITCPLTKGVEYTYSNKFTVYNAYPEFSNLTTKWRLNDENNNAIVCLEIPVKIVAQH